VMKWTSTLSALRDSAEARGGGNAVAWITLVRC